MKLFFTHKRVSFFLFLILLLILGACNPSSVPSQNENFQTPEIKEEDNDNTPPLPSTEETPKFGWFEPTPQLFADWNIIPDSDNKFRISLSQKTQADSTNNAKKILFFYKKRHYRYDEVIERALSVFLEKGVPIEVSLLLAEEDEAAFNALSHAEANHIDLIFAMGSSSTTFLHENYQNGEIPVVTLLSKDPVLMGQVHNYESGSGTNIAYTSVGIPIGLQMSYFQTLVPNLKNIIVLYAESNNSAIKTQVEPLDIYAKSADINIIHVITQTKGDEEGIITELEEELTEALEKIHQLDPEMKESVLFLTTSSSIIDVFENVNAIAGNIPILSLYPELVREGLVSAVLSVGIRFDSNAILAAHYGVQILQDGIAPGDLSVGVITPPDIAINFAKAREIGLKIPFSFFESASYIYNLDGVLVRDKGQPIEQP